MGVSTHGNRGQVLVSTQEGKHSCCRQMLSVKCWAGYSPALAFPNGKEAEASSAGWQGGCSVLEVAQTHMQGPLTHSLALPTLVRELWGSVSPQDLLLKRMTLSHVPNWL